MNIKVKGALLLRPGGSWAVGNISWQWRLMVMLFFFSYMDPGFPGNPIGNIGIQFWSFLKPFKAILGHFWAILVPLDPIGSIGSIGPLYSL